MQHEKYSIKAGYLVLLWFGLMFGVTIALMLLLILPIHIFVFKRSLQYGESIFAIGIFLLCIAVWKIWRISTFTRRDFIKIAESMGITRIRKKFYYSIWDYGSVYSFSDGYINDIYFVARIDSPFFAYAPSPRISLEKLIKSPDKYKSKMATFMVGGYTPKYMEEESRVEIFSLICAPLNFDVKIRIEAGKCEIQKTGSGEIDELLVEFLKNIDHFNARLSFYKDCLRMSIIGGSWQGEKFKRKILKGFEVFQRIHSELKKKYPAKSWDDWQIRWDAVEGRFCMDSKVMPS